jgi:nicotinate dehydrogenase subunit B
VPRVDIPAKAKAELIFVHDVRIEGMLHGRVIRPPYAGIDSGEFVGKSLIGVDHDSVGHVPGLKAIVVVGDFIGVVCEREEHAEQAMRDLRVHWREWPGLGNLQDTASALSQHPYAEREFDPRGQYR